MTLPWLESFPRTVAPLLDEVDSTLDFPLSRLIREGPSSTLSAVENSQPAILATSIIILRVLEQEFHFKISERVHFTLGHSLGEFSALVAAGHLDFHDALRIVRRRAEVMASITRLATSSSSSPLSSSSSSARDASEERGEYGMIALVCEKAEHLPPLIEAIEGFLGPASTRADVTATEEEATTPEIMEQVSIANVNAKNQIVLSGRIERIKILLTHLRQFAGHDPRAVRLNTDCAFHSPLMKPAEEMMREWLSRRSSLPMSSSSNLDGVRGRSQDGYSPAVAGTAAPEDANGKTLNATELSKKNENVKNKHQENKKEIIKWPSKLTCISTITGRPFSSRENIIDLLSRQCVETVLWSESIRYLDQECHVRRWLGIGPGLVGRNLVGKEVGMRSSSASASPPPSSSSSSSSSLDGSGEPGDGQVPVRGWGPKRDWEYKGGVGNGDRNEEEAQKRGMIKGGGVWGISDPRDIEGILRALDQTEGSSGF